MNNFKLNATDFDLTTSNAIKINLANLPDDIKIADAVLNVKVQSANKNSEISVHYAPIGSSSSSEGWQNVDSVTLSEDKILKINISDELQDALLKEATQLQLTFDANIVFVNDLESDFINIDYISLSEFQKNGSSHKINLGKSGQASIDLSTGKLNLSTPIVLSNKKALPLSISANYHNTKNIKMPNIGLPSNWHLNVNQFLIKEENSNNLSFTYIDENGKNQLIEEKYYYMNNKEKVYVNRADLELNFDGTYKYGDYEIKTELIAPSGLKLSSSIHDVKGANLVDYEPEELISIKKQLSDACNSYTDIETSLKLCNRQLCLLILSKTAIEKQITNQKNSIVYNQDYNNLLDKIEYIRGEFARKNRTFKCPDDENNVKEYAKNYLGNKNFSDSLLNQIINYCQNNTPIVNNGETLTALDVSVVVDTLLEEASSIYTFGYNYNAKGTGNLKLQQLSNNLNIELYNNEITKDSFKNEILNYVNPFGLNEDKLELESVYNNFIKNDKDEKLTYSLKDVITLDLQIENTIYTIQKYIKQKDELEKTKDKLSYQKSFYEAQLPLHYLYDSNNIIYGFGKMLNSEDKETNIYRLVLITDPYENSIVLTYESNKSARIKSISESSEQSIVFEYNNSTGYLKNIVDSRNNKFSFTISNNVLESINKNNEQLRFTYDGDSMLKGVLSPSGTGVRFDYNNNQISEVQAISVVEKIEHNKYVYKTTYENNKSNFIDCVVDDSKVSFIYDNYKSTSVINKQNKRITYVFDKYGKVCSIYENTYSGDLDSFNPEQFTTKVNQYNYEDDNLLLKISKLPYSINYLEDIHFNSDSSVTYKETLSLGSLICSSNSIPYSYPVYENYYSLPTANNVASSTISVSGDMIKKINDETQTILTNLNNDNDTSICKHRMFVLSGWAKADSAFITTERESIEYPDYISSRKFGLRAIVKYKNQSLPVEHNICFDWRNTAWQQVSLPITLELQEVVSIDCVIDYSNNTGTILFTDLELKQGDFEKIEYNSCRLPAKKTTGHSEWETTYSYDENNNLICETIKSLISNTSYITDYEYNKSGKLTKITTNNSIIKENIYNDKGILVKSLTYHKDEPANILYEDSIFDEKGNKPYEINSFGEKIHDNYFIDKTGVISHTIDNTGAITSYGYNNNDMLIQTTTTINSEENYNTYGYTLDLLTSLSHNQFDIKYAYDSQGRKTKTSIADNEYISKIYDKNEEISFLKLSNNPRTYDVYKHTYDKNGNVLDIYYKHKYVIEDETSTLPKNIKFTEDDHIVQNIYDTYGNLVYCKDHTNNNNNIYTYDYDNFGNVVSEENTQHESSISIENEYDVNHSNIKHRSIEIDSDKVEYAYDYSNAPNAQLTKISSMFGDELISYDNLGRLKSIEKMPIQKEFNYLKIGDRTSNLISKIDFASGKNINDTLTYRYDKKGNITEVRQFNKLMARYKYDSLSRIVREDNVNFNTTTTYEYDSGGNILNKKIYDFTIIDNLDFEKEKELIPYIYPIKGWRDQLQSYNGKDFNYDEAGNPTTFKNNTLEWICGRQLKKFGDIADFTYNANGIRTTKFANGYTTYYYLDGNKIVRQSDSLHKLDFYYGSEGVCGFHILSKNIAGQTIIDANYFYKKNAQNDIIGIIDNNGKQIARYTYDAWGNQKSEYLKTNTLENGETIDDFVAFDDELIYNNINEINQFIAHKNPFRYRSYYYDFETHLYYLNSRYYDPEIGRFVNADNIDTLDISKIVINGLNLYAYCLNNPVNEIDENGYAVGWLLGLLIAALIGAGVGAVAYTASVVIRGITTGKWEFSLGDFIGSVLGGFIGGAFAIIPFAGTYLSAYITGFVSSVLSDVSNNLIYGTPINENFIGNALWEGVLALSFNTIVNGKYFVKGITFGRGSWSAITSQIYTKFRHNVIKRISLKTFGKMFGLSLYESTIDMFYGSTK